MLSLDNLSPSGEYDYFAGAMTEEITSALSKVPDLRVTSRNSAAKFAAANVSVREFARELAVAHVLEGSVQRVGDRVRITVQLIDARTDEHVWSESYERELVDVLQVQVDIAEQIADRLAASFSNREREPILAGVSGDPVAYDLYLRAQQVEPDLAGPEEIDESIGQLRRATEREPTFSLAWAELSFRYRLNVSYAGCAWTDSSGAALDRAIESADDTALAVVLRAVRGVLGGGDREEGLAWLREAVANHPSDYTYTLVSSHARLQRFTGNLPEVTRWFRRAAAIDPLSPIPWIFLAEAYSQVGLYDRAERALRRAMELEPGSPWPWLELDDLQVARSEYEAALTPADSLEHRSDELGRALVPGSIIARGPGPRPGPDGAGGRFADGGGADGPLPHTPHGPPPVPERRFRRGKPHPRRVEARLGMEADVLPAADEFLALKVAALRGDESGSVEALRAYVEAGGRSLHEIERSPLSSRVRRDSAFRAELHDLERMRRQIEQDLATRR